MLSVVLLAVLSAGPQKVALLPLSPGAGVTPQISQSLTDALAAELRKLPGHQLLTQQELTAVLGVERQRQLAGCTETSCMTEIASALDADAVVTGSLARLGQSWLLQVQLIDARKGVTRAHASRRKKSAEIDDLLDELPGVAKELFGAAPPPQPVTAVEVPPVAAAPELPSPQADVPLEVSAEARKRLVLLEDPAGRYLAVEPFSGIDGGFYYGASPTKLHAQRVFGGGSSGRESFSLSFWEPRARWPAEASFDFRDGRYELTCGKHQLKLSQVAPKEAAKLLAKAQLFEARWRRRAYALARDDEGLYFYVDQARLPEDSQDLRVYVGKSGKVRAYPTEVIAHDSAGDVLKAADGTLKLQLGKSEAQWSTASGPVKLTVLPVEDQARFIYSQLGAYQGLELGTPCDGHLP